MNNDYVRLHFIVLVWGFTAILGKLISIPAVELVFYRTLIASAVLGTVLFIRRGRFSIGFAAISKILGTGILISAHWILFFASARVSTISVCLAGMATCSLWTSLIEPLVTKRKVKALEVCLGVIVMFGLYIIFRFEFNHALGLGMALFSAFLAALFSVINGQFAKVHNPYMITFYEMLGAAIGTLLFFPLYLVYMASDRGLQLTPSSMDWLYIIVLAVICTVYTFSVSVELMKRMSAFAVNLAINMEPIYGIILALIIFKDSEQMNVGFYVGAAIILLSVLAYPVVNKRLNRKLLDIDN